VGHSYSVLAGLPEKDDKKAPPWVIPLSIRRVPTDKKATDVGASQLEDILKDKELPFGSHLSSVVGDSTYSACEFIGQVVEHENLVSFLNFMVCADIMQFTLYPFTCLSIHILTSIIVYQLGISFCSN
jgi:hypothetical protein